MSEKGLGRLRKGETAGNNILEKGIIYDFRQFLRQVRTFPNVKLHFITYS